MKSYLKLRIFSWVTIKPWLLLAVLLLCVFLSGTCLAEEKSSNGVSTNDIRTELSNAQDAKSDIAGTTSDIANTSSDIAETVGNLANSINNVTDTSERFDQLINECQSIIDQIREQPAGE